MVNRHPRLAKEECEQTKAEIKQLEDQLIQLIQTLEAAYGKSSRITRFCRTARSKTQQMQDIIDEELHLLANAVPQEDQEHETIS